MLIIYHPVAYGPCKSAQVHQ